MIRDRGVDPELLDEVSNVLEYLSSQGYRTFTVKKVMQELRKMESNGMLDGHRSEPEVRRALQALVMDEKNIPNTTFGSEIKPWEAQIYKSPKDQKLLPYIWGEENLAFMPRPLDSNLTLGLGQN